VGPVRLRGIPRSEGDHRLGGLKLAFQALSLLLFVALESRLVLRALQGITDVGDALLAVLALALAFLVSDLVSGLVHWWCDTFFAEDTPILGSALIQPFREHHRDPLAITRHGFFERNHANILAVLPILVWDVLTDASAAGGRAAVFATAFLAGFGLAMAMTNQIHAWAHSPRVPRVVRQLQRAGLLLRPRHHVRHHRDGLAYCITGGWLDAPLERARIFEKLERTVRRA
jgi:hypothetical protein